MTGTVSFRHSRPQSQSQSSYSTGLFRNSPVLSGPKSYRKLPKVIIVTKVSLWNTDGFPRAGVSEWIHTRQNGPSLIVYSLSFLTQYFSHFRDFNKYLLQRPLFISVFHPLKFLLKFTFLLSIKTFCLNKFQYLRKTREVDSIQNKILIIMERLFFTWKQSEEVGEK